MIEFPTLLNDLLRRSHTIICEDTLVYIMEEMLK